MLKIAGAKAAPLPDFVKPCLAKPTECAPAGSLWVHEIKLDGYRLQARLDGGSVRLLTRTGLDWTHRFASIAAVLNKAPFQTALIDGEVIAEDAAGLPSFVKLVEALKAGRSETMIFFAFDLLHLDGFDLTGASLADRKQLLEKALKKGPRNERLRFSQHFDCDGSAMLAEACKLKLEGVISKRTDKPYRSGRHDDWLKSKCVDNDEFVVVGYLDSTAFRNAVGALVLGYFEKGKLVYAGRAGTGFDRTTAGALWQLLHPMKSPPPEFARGLSGLQRRNVKWVRPEAVVQVEYRGWTADALLRQAAFKGLREDIPASSVKQSRPFDQTSE